MGLGPLGWALADAARGALLCVEATAVQRGAVTERVVPWQAWGTQQGRCLCMRACMALQGKRHSQRHALLLHTVAMQAMSAWARLNLSLTCTLAVRCMVDSGRHSTARSVNGMHVRHQVHLQRERRLQMLGQGGGGARMCVTGRLAACCLRCKGHDVGCLDQASTSKAGGVGSPAV